MSTNASPLVVALAQADLYRRYVLTSRSGVTATITTVYQGHHHAVESVVYADANGSMLDLDVEIEVGVHPNWIDVFDSWGCAPGARAIVSVSMDTPTTWHIEAGGSSLEMPQMRELVETLAAQVKTNLDDELADDERIAIGIMNDSRAVNLVKGGGRLVTAIDVELDVDRSVIDGLFVDRPYRRIMVTIGANSLSYSIAEPGFPTEVVTIR